MTEKSVYISVPYFIIEKNFTCISKTIKSIIIIIMESQVKRNEKLIYKK